MNIRTAWSTENKAVDRQQSNEKILCVRYVHKTHKSMQSHHNAFGVVFSILINARISLILFLLELDL